ncbi:hypothetical protein [Paludisphaera borealis]|uniref:Uncharacterized protein n=1 Tax=Paludisphaera borealis TaxID=1387353 RepID=A0A1U7CQT8_9BACT|nr:hypothetical protein [Paludisphaera borealis]APW61305.1 hypothetical protein BSF38_02819 [Paludisphaera borealis]
MAESSTSIDDTSLARETNGRASPLPVVAEPAAVAILQDLADLPQVVASTRLLRLDSWEIGASVAALGLWLLLLAAGLSVAAQDYIDAIQHHNVSGVWAIVGSLFVISTCHTVTNTALMCCASAFLGALGFRVTGGKPEAVDGVADRRNAYVAAVTRGFFIFLIIQSGSIILSDQAFTNLTLEKYIRLVGLSSLLSFTVGYNPEVFRQLMDRVDKKFSDVPPNSGGT